MKVKMQLTTRKVVECGEEVERIVIYLGTEEYEIHQVGDSLRITTDYRILISPRYTNSVDIRAER